MLQLDHAVLHLLDEEAEASHEVPSFFVLTCYVLTQNDRTFVPCRELLAPLENAQVL